MATFSNDFGFSSGIEYGVLKGFGASYDILKNYGSSSVFEPKDWVARGSVS